MRMAAWKTAVGVLSLIGVLYLPAWSAYSNDRHTANPGALNYIEGQVSIGDRTLDSKAVGSTQLQAGQVLSTANGKAELLLTLGVYLRLGDNSSVKMISPNLTNTTLVLDQGDAMLEVDEIYSQNDIRVNQPGASTRILKTGLYQFSAENRDIRVFDGKAAVETNDHTVTVKGGHELDLNAEGKLKAQGFDKKKVAQNDDLYRWSSLRSEYLSEASEQTARIYVANGWYGPGWFGPGWYWDPWFGTFTFLPARGFLYNPFGWGFYSPLVVYRGTFVRPGVPRRFEDARRAPAIGDGFHNHAVRSFHSAPPSRGFHGGPPSAGFRGGPPAPPPR